MNGLNIIDIEEASFMDKVLRREPRENAFVEINNLLACVPILQIDKESIENCLNKHNITYEKARSRLLNYYSIIFQFFIRDVNVSNAEVEKLAHLQRILSLENKEVIVIHKTYTHPIYKRYVINAVSDGILTDEEKNTLLKVSKRLRIPKSETKKIYVNEASKYLHSVLKSSIEDGMLSGDEEKELEKMAESLQVELKYSENAKKNLQRCRFLWKLYCGKLPKISVPIYLEKNEFCSGQTQALHYEVSNAFHPVKYSGFQQMRREYGREFHSGKVPLSPKTQSSLRYIDQGTLFFTNKRLLFKGSNGASQFMLINLIGGSFYNNGMLIELESGRDQFFKFRGDMESLRLIFDSLMTKSRR